MKRISIKWKLTILYTLFMMILVCITWTLLLSLSNREILSSVKQQLKDQVYGSFDELEYEDQTLDIDSDILNMENGIFLSVYDGQKKFLYGKIPADFPAAPALKNDELHTVSANGITWYTFDSKHTLNGYGDVYIRGILSVTKTEASITVLIRMSLFIMPVLVILAAVLGYFIIGKLLRPVNTMIHTVLEIQESEDLSKRIPGTKTQDEFYRLAECFNDMLSRLETSFQREKQFTSDVSHELRTPITVILSHCDYLMEQGTLPKDCQKELEIIQQRASNMAKMVSQLLLLSRPNPNISPLNVESINVSELTEMVVEEERIPAEVKQIQIYAEIEPAIKTAADQALLIRLWVNLINNAIQYGKEGGRITVTLQKTNTNIIGAVMDDGIGIEPEDLPHIWQRFYQADPSRTSEQSGAGLGLPMVKWIAEAHGGHIEVTSTKNIGSKFTFFIPIRNL